MHILFWHWFFFMWQKWCLWHFRRALFCSQCHHPLISLIHDDIQDKLEPLHPFMQQTILWVWIVSFFHLFLCMKLIVYGNSCTSWCNNLSINVWDKLSWFFFSYGTVIASNRVFYSVRARAYLGVVWFNSYYLNSVPFITLFFFTAQNMVRSLQKALMKSLVCPKKGAGIDFCVSFLTDTQGNL